jgi:hypothetical protein
MNYLFMLMLNLTPTTPVVQPVPEVRIIQEEKPVVNTLSNEMDNLRFLETQA